MTTKFANRTVVLFVIVILALSLSACGETGSLTNLVASASDGAVTAQSVRTHARTEACDFGSKQILLNAVAAELDTATGKVEGITLDNWLDNKMSSVRCIAPVTAE